MEPRGALHSTIVSWSRRESVASESGGDGGRIGEPLLLKFHDEPALPVHPALEYEVVAPVEPPPPPAPAPPAAAAEAPEEGIATNNNNNNKEQEDEEAVRRSKEEKRKSSNQWKLLAAFFFLIVSGVGTVVSAKLQAIPMRNYPNFLNLFGQLLYIPLCFAYLVPASRSSSRSNSRRQPLQQQSGAPNNIIQNRFSLSQWWPRRQLMKRLAVMGALDCLATTLQTFAAVYLPGPLLVLLPQAAIPVSLGLSRSRRFAGGNAAGESGLALQQWAGAATVLLGIGIVLQPVLLRRHAPDYCCEAQDVLHHCTLCQTAVTEDACLSLTVKDEGDEDGSTVMSLTSRRWLEVNQQVPLSLLSQVEQEQPCRWLPFEESSKEKEFLELFWSLALIASTVPMALSALYKQRAMLSVEERAAEQAAIAAATAMSETDDTNAVLSPPPPPALYVSGWIAVFQFLCSVAIAVPAGLLSSPSLRPWEVPSNLFYGMFCYAGVGVVETGCHPDTACSDSALWVNVTVLCHVVYTLSMMLVLKYSGGGDPALLFLGLTAIVPIGHLFFALPFMPERTAIHSTDLAGLIVILAGLVFYRFSTLTPPPNATPEEHHHQEQEGNAGIVGASQQRQQGTTITPRKQQSPLKRQAAARQEQEHRRSRSISIADLFAEQNVADDVDVDNADEGDLQQHASLCLGSLWQVQNQTSYTLLRRDTATAGARSEDV